MVTNGTDLPFTGQYDEVIPKSVSAALSEISFTPHPNHTISRDPIAVRYSLNLASRASIQIAYKTNVGATRE